MIQAMGGRAKYIRRPREREAPSVVRFPWGLVASLMIVCGVAVHISFVSALFK